MEREDEESDDDHGIGKDDDQSFRTYLNIIYIRQCKIKLLCVEKLRDRGNGVIKLGHHGKESKDAHHRNRMACRGHLFFRQQFLKEERLEIRFDECCRCCPNRLLLHGLHARHG